MNLAGLIGSLPTVAATLARKSAGTLTKGVYSGGTAVTSTIQVIYWPASPREIERLPEGVRTRESIGIASQERLRAAESLTGTQADIITVDGLTYEVQVVSSYVAQASMCHSVATRAA